MKFGDFLKKNREAKKWTQPEAASNIGIEQSYLSKLENNKAVPSADIFQRLMNAYSFDVRQICHQVEDSELEKLKDIVLIRDFIIANKKRTQKMRHLWLLAGLVAITIGAGLVTYGIAIRQDVALEYLYESKGLINPGEPKFLFAEMPSYEDFSTSSRLPAVLKNLQSNPLYQRLDFEQTISLVYRGDFYDESIQSTGQIRRFVMLKQRVIPTTDRFIKILSIGVMFLAGGCACFFICKRW